jgi:hypothetical protein
MGGSGSSTPGDTPTATDTPGSGGSESQQNNQDQPTPTAEPIEVAPEYDFERVTTDNWGGTISIQNTSVEISHDGSFDDSLFSSSVKGAAVRASPIGGTSYDVVFEDVSVDRFTVEHNIDFGLTEETKGNLFNAGSNKHISVTSAEGINNAGTQRFALRVSDSGFGAPVEESDVFGMRGSGNDVRITYDPPAARAYVNGEEVASMSTDISADFHSAVSLEDDPDADTSATVSIGSYTEQ